MAEDRDPKDLVRDYWDKVWGEGNLDVLGDFVADPYRRHSPSGTRTMSLKAFGAEMAQYQRTLHRPKTDVKAITVDGDLVWSRLVSVGLNVDTGEKSVITWMVCNRIERDRIAESWMMYLPMAWDEG